MENYHVLDAGYVVFDALWVLASALNNTMSMVNSGDISRTDCENVPGSLEHLHNFNYKNMKMGCVIRWSLNNTNFSGVSVSFRFVLVSTAINLKWCTCRVTSHMTSTELGSIVVLYYVSTLSMVRCNQNHQA